MPDIGENFLRIGLVQIDPVVRSQVLRVQITVARSGFRRHPHQVSQYIRHLVTGRVKARNVDLLFACFPEPNEGVTIARRCAGPEVNVIGPPAGRLGSFGWFRTFLRRRRVGRGNRRCNTGLPYLDLAALGVVLQTLQIGLQGRVLRRLLRVAATAPDGCKDKNSRYKKRAPNYPIRCCHVRTLNQLSLAACQAHPASPPRWIHGTAAKQSQPLVTIGAGALPTGYLPIGALPIGAFPTGACE